MASDDISFITHVTWDKDGHTHYVSISGVAEPLEVEDPDPEAEQPFGARTGVLSIPASLFLRAFGRLPVILDADTDLDYTSQHFKVTLFTPDKFQGRVAIELVALLALLESTVTYEHCEEGHEFVCKCRLATRSYSDYIRTGNCIAAHFDVAWRFLPEDASAEGLAA